MINTTGKAQPFGTGPATKPALFGLFAKEDWWAIWLGLGIVLAALALHMSGSSMKWLAIVPRKWSTPDQLLQHFVANAPRYAAQFLFWLSVFGASLKVMGRSLREFVPSFTFVYFGSLLIFALGAWEESARYNLEPPLVALVVGMAISNLTGLPRWMESGFRVEYYIKTGIVLLGATLPFTLMVWAGPLAILQASIVSVATFMTIFWVGRRLGLDPRFCATLGAGGAVCGVSASIAVAGVVGAKKEDVPVAITLVILWAVVMIFVLPFLARSLGLHTAVAGAWIGASEFADAAGFAAAQAYGNLAGKVEGIEGTAEQGIWAFTLMKVVGRDVWIGVWAFILAIVASTRWENQSGVSVKADPREIWRRFPKFVIGFLVASLLITLLTGGGSFQDYNKTVVPTLISPIKDLRTWAFIFCFFSIGLTTRLRDLVGAGSKPFAAFTAGVALNVLLGFLLSVFVFADYWKQLGQ